MNKNLLNYLSSNGFVYDNTCFCGSLKGYQISGVCVGNTINLAFYVNVAENEAQQIYDWLNNNKRAYSITAMSVDQISVNCTINALFNSVQKCIELMINTVDFLATFKSPHCCPFCGESFESKINGEEENASDESHGLEQESKVRLVGIGANRFYAHENCFDDYANAVANNEVIAASAPNNYLRGSLGAVLGGLLGCIFWVILYIIGYLAVIAAIAISLSAAFFWDKFGGKNNKIKILAIWLISLILITVVMFVMYLIEVKIVMAEYGYTGSALEFFISLIKTEPEVVNSITYNTVFSYVSMAVGNVYTTFHILRTQKLTSSTLIKL